MTFRILASDPCGARAGIWETARGPVETPVFMPVATQASVKALDADDIRRLGVRAILANSYHLGLRPGADTVRAAGGLHKFMDFDGFIITDSGGFQVLSLSKFREVDDDGVTFRSHLDGSKRRLTAESVIAAQAELGSDGWTTLDELPPYPAEPLVAERALDRTMRWIDRSVPAVAAARAAGARSMFMPILQGGLHPALRRRSVAHMNDTPAEAVSIGGFMVGEDKPTTWAALGETTANLTPSRPRYLMGVGTPEDLWNSVACGVDMMDCVYPTRVARTGQVMSDAGKFNITNARFRRDFTPLDPACECFVCGTYTRAYLGHLIRAKELSAYRLISYHNLHFMAILGRRIRSALLAGKFASAKAEFMDAQKSGAATASIDASPAKCDNPRP